jgi:hypothetical protein
LKFFQTAIPQAVKELANSNQQIHQQEVWQLNFAHQSEASATLRTISQSDVANEAFNGVGLLAIENVLCVCVANLFSHGYQFLSSFVVLIIPQVRGFVNTFYQKTFFYFFSKTY